MILSGRLTEKLTLKTLSVSATTYGEVIETYTPAKVVYASITNQRGNNSFNGSFQGDIYSDNISFYLRYLKLTEDKKKYRIEYNGQDYNIRNITVVQRNSAMVIECENVN